MEMPCTLTVAITADTDLDGLPDEWEIQHFGNLNQTASGDPDGDGFTNLQEYLADPNPLDGESYLCLKIGLAQEGLWVEWQGGSAAQQILQVKYDLTNSAWIDLWTNEPPTLLTGRYFDSWQTNAMKLFQLKATRP